MKYTDEPKPVPVVPVPMPRKPDPPIPVEPPKHRQTKEERAEELSHKTDEFGRMIGK